MLKKIAFPLLLMAILFTACGGNAVVVIDNHAPSGNQPLKPSKITVDEKLDYMLGDSAVAIKLSAGKHIVQVNGGAKREFMVTGNGGILNLGDIDYVIYEIEYASADKTGDADIADMSYLIKKPIIIDSFVIVQKPKANRKIPNSTWLSYVKEDTSGLNKHYKKLQEANNKRSHFKKTGKGELFVERDWDYNITDTIPESVETLKSKANMAVSVKKSAVMRASTFLLYAMMSKDEYIVREIKDILEGKEYEEEVE